MPKGDISVIDQEALLYIAVLWVFCKIFYDLLITKKYHVLSFYFIDIYRCCLELMLNNQIKTMQRYTSIGNDILYISVSNFKVTVRADCF